MKVVRNRCPPNKYEFQNDGGSRLGRLMTIHGYCGFFEKNLTDFWTDFLKDFLDRFFDNFMKDFLAEL